MPASNSTQRRSLGDRILLAVVAILSAGFVLAVAGVVAFIWWPRSPVGKDTRSWTDVDETVEDWTRPVPHVGQPRHVALYEGFTGTIAKVDLVVPTIKEVAPVLQALGISEDASTTCFDALNGRRIGICDVYAGFPSRRDGKKHGWSINVKVNRVSAGFEIRLVGHKSYN